jgi:rSAM/selenodomain-associated transferase 2
LSTRFSVIIPAFNEIDWIPRILSHLRSLDAAAQIIVADGGSSDGTTEAAARQGAEVIRCSRGRGSQCNAGSHIAKGETLMFLHADTLLPPNAFSLLEDYFANPRVEIGTFRLSFDDPDPVLRAYAALTRFDSMFTRFGDQCIVVRRSFFSKIGGFPNWPLFEDVQFLRQARRITKVYSFPACVLTSSRRFLQLGVFRTQILNVKLFAKYLLGMPPHILLEQYEKSLRSGKGAS